MTTKIRRRLNPLVAGVHMGPKIVRVTHHSKTHLAKKKHSAFVSLKTRGEHSEDRRVTVHFKSRRKYFTPYHAALLAVYPHFAPVIEDAFLVYES